MYRERRVDSYNLNVEIVLCGGEDMSIKFKQYHDKYFDSCVQLVKETWNLEKGFKNPKNIIAIYEHYFLTCLNWNVHLEIMVDEDDTVKGILFGSIEDASYSVERKFKKIDKELKKWTVERINDGSFGEKNMAKKRLVEFANNDKIGERYADRFDSEVNLFIVSSELRGQGYGIKLMDNYVDFCKKNGLKTAFLWTDVGCSYTFYDKYGFELYDKYHCPSLTDGDKALENGMVYYLEIK